jgi:mannose/fructose/N-acetylgalactosamine-specific phosphotransferase system component IID
VAPVKVRLANSFLRLFAVQGSWNYQRMLGIGVGVAEEPLLRDLKNGQDDAAYRAAVARGARFFNAHPYLAGLAVGAAARAEHDGMPPAQIERFRDALVSPLGALGDQLVWAGWLPLLASAALAAIALGSGWIAVAAFMLIYNVGHVTLRWWALAAGWKHGAHVAAALHAAGLQRAIAWAVPAMGLAAGFALPLVAETLAGPFGGWERGTLAAAAVAGFIMLRLIRGAVDGLRLGLGFVAIALILGWLWP